VDIRELEMPTLAVILVDSLRSCIYFLSFQHYFFREMEAINSELHIYDKRRRIYIDLLYENTREKMNVNKRQKE
jgi:hypothetical protein